MGSKFNSVRSGCPSHLSCWSFSCNSDMWNNMAHPDSFLCVVMCCAQSPPPPLFCCLIILVLSFFAIPMVDPKNKMGMIIHTVSKVVLGNNTKNKIYGNLNYAKTFIWGTVMNVFNGCMLGRKNAVHKLTVNFEIPSNKTALGVKMKRVAIHQQHCTFWPVLADEKPQCSVNCTDLIGKPN
jgi:hypothetical protein